ncbi:MAG: MipA/OmpV family protein [Chakrabartia sp.]
MRTFQIGLCASAMLFTSAGMAQTVDGDAPQNDNHIAIGLGALMQESPFKGEKSQVYPLPLVSVKKGVFYIEAAEVGLQISPDVGGKFKPSLSGFVTIRTPSGRDRAKVTADAGIRAALETPVGQLSAEYRHDISNKFDGGEFIGRYSFPISLGKVTITPAAQVSMLDRKTANYMYGVTAKQRAKMIAKHRDVIQPIYTVTDKATNLGGDISTVWQISDRIMLLGILGGTYLDKSVRLNRPTVKKWESQAILGVAYKF